MAGRSGSRSHLHSIPCVTTIQGGLAVARSLRRARRHTATEEPSGMASDRLKARLGPIELRSPLIAASGTVGSVWEWAEVLMSLHTVPPSPSRSPRRVDGPSSASSRPSRPRDAQRIGIQNPGIEAWVEKMRPLIGDLGVPVWDSQLGRARRVRHGGQRARLGGRPGSRGQSLLPQPRRRPHVLPRCLAVSRKSSPRWLRAARSR